MKLVTARQMQELDRQTIELDHVPQSRLMQRAGRAVAETARSLIPRRGSILILAGPGNNGGDALIAGKLLKRQGYAVNVVQLPHAGNGKSEIGNVDLVIDGLLGTGLSRPVKGEFKNAIDSLNRAKIKNPSLQIVA